MEDYFANLKYIGSNLNAANEEVRENMILINPETAYKLLILPSDLDIE